MMKRGCLQKSCRGGAGKFSGNNGVRIANNFVYSMSDWGVCVWDEEIFERCLHCYIRREILSGGQHTDGIYSQ